MYKLGGINMYCKNCGNPISNYDIRCSKCGLNLNNNQFVCSNCGSPISPSDNVCSNCGANIIHNVNVSYTRYEQKSKIAAGLLGIFLGGFGVHNFYLGYIGKGIAQIILTFCFGIGFIWGFIEGILILTGSISTDANGIPLKE